MTEFLRKIPDQLSPTDHHEGPSEQHECPKCGTANQEDRLTQSLYQCERCGLELAYLDTAPNGTVRGILGYLRSSGDVVQDRYRIRSLLGKGGFGATYLIEDLRLNGKARALKEIPEPFFDEQEIELLSRLRHPSIPDITDRSVADGMVHLVLEFGGSRTLEIERRQSGGRIPLPRLIPWMRELCKVLSYLHSHDPPVVHRDLKPGNILLDNDDRIMLADFGIAKESSASAQTRTLARAACHGFSPPEQVLGTGTDERSDIYALAATLYVLLTGKVPPAAHERIAGEELVAPSALVDEVPLVLDEEILRAMELNINRRQRSIAQFAQVFEDLDSTTGPSVSSFVPNTEGVVRGNISPPAGDRLSTGKPRASAWAAKRRLLIAVGITCILGVGIAIGTYLSMRDRSQPRTAGASTSGAPNAKSAVSIGPRTKPGQPTSYPRESESTTTASRTDSGNIPEDNSVTGLLDKTRGNTQDTVPHKPAPRTWKRAKPKDPQRIPRDRKPTAADGRDKTREPPGAKKWVITRGDGSKTY